MAMRHGPPFYGVLETCEITVEPTQLLSNRVSLAMGWVLTVPQSRFWFLYMAVGAGIAVTSTVTSTGS